MLLQFTSDSVSYINKVCWEYILEEVQKYRVLLRSMTRNFISVIDEYHILRSNLNIDDKLKVSDLFEHNYNFEL